MGTEETVGEEKSASSEKNAKNQEAEDGVDEPGPNGERHARQGHALGTKIERGDGEIKGGQQSSEAEERDAGAPKREAGIGMDKKAAVMPASEATVAQNENRFMSGNAISRAPICRGKK